MCNVCLKPERYIYIYNTIKEMKRTGMSILGTSEMRWPGSGDRIIDEYRRYLRRQQSSCTWSGYYCHQRC